jgi:phage baseplate assembly protein gpV
MEDQSRQGMSVQQQFRIRRNRQLMTAIPIVLFVLAMSTEDKAAQTVLGLPIAIVGPIAAVLAVGLLVFSFMNWRCPACRRYLGRRINPKFCGSCGAQLRGGVERYVTSADEVNPASAPIQPSRGGAAKWVAGVVAVLGLGVLALFAFQSSAARDAAAASSSSVPAPAHVRTATPAPAPAPAPGGAAAITWATTDGALDFGNGRTATLTCPPNGQPHNVWGHGIYTGDSSVCTAAVHAGVITLERGGPITVERRGGQKVYGSSTRNGVKTAAYKAWHTSFVFPQAEVTAAEADAATPISWDSKGIEPPNVGEQITVSCPAGGTPDRAWGKDIYTGDSSLCTAAVHAGVITLERGGAFSVEQRGPQQAFDGTTRNGIRTESYGAWGNSFAVKPLR